MAEQEWGKIQKLEELLNITKSAAWRLVREGRLPDDAYCYVNGRTVRVNIPVVKRWASEGGLGRPAKRSEDSED